MTVLVYIPECVHFEFLMYKLLLFCWITIIQSAKMWLLVNGLSDNILPYRCQLYCFEYSQ